MAKILALFFLTLLAFSAFAEVEEDEGVLVLTDDNFDEQLKLHERILVEFYAPWCGHCKKLAPEYVDAAAKLAAAGSDVKLAKVDATEQKDVAARFEVKGFPTLKWFVNGEAIEFNGGRTADEIVSWIQKKSGPPSTVLTAEEIEKISEEKFTVVFFGAEDSAEFKAFTKTALGDDKNSFRHVFDESTNAPEGLTRPGVAVYRDFDEPIVVHEGDFTDEALADFVVTASIPTLVEFSDEFIEPIFQSQNPAVFLFVDSSNEEHTKYIDTLRTAAVANKGRIIFAHSGVTGGIQQRLAEFVGVTTEDLPRLMIVSFNAQGIDKFVYDGELSELTADDVEKFVDGFEKGSLSKFLKSEPVPETNEEPVKVVVGDNFNDIVGHEDEVLLEFYAPWCGHCKSLEPKYTELATDLKNVEGLVIAKMDSTANEVEGISIQGFPTIKFFPKGSTTPVDYEGDREIEAFKTYLKENSEAYKAALEVTEDL